MPFTDFVFCVNHRTRFFSDMISFGIYSNYTYEETLIRETFKLHGAARLVNGRGIVTPHSGHMLQLSVEEGREGGRVCGGTHSGCCIRIAGPHTVWLYPGREVSGATGLSDPWKHMDL